MDYDLGVWNSGGNAFFTSNRSYMSFIILNPPNATSLDATDSDSDGLTDVHEVHVSFTHPFIADTDGDGVNDNIDYAPNDWTDKSEKVSVTVRTSGEDYCTWIGKNVTLAEVAADITSSGYAAWSSNDNISILGDDGYWINHTLGDGEGTTVIHTFDVLKTNLADDTGDLTINIASNSDWDYDAGRTFDLDEIGDGYNYTGWIPSTSTTLSAENTSVGLTSGYFIALWNETTYTWNYWISGFGITNKNIHQYDVCVTKVSQDRSWTQP